MLHVDTGNSGICAGGQSSHHLSSGNLKGPYSKLITELYYRAVYVLYPQPVYLDGETGHPTSEQRRMSRVLTLEPTGLDLTAGSCA